jgi:hypothetical protein
MTNINHTGFSMEVTPLNDRMNVGQLQIKMPYSYDQIHEELIREDWKESFGHADYWGGYRSSCNKPIEKNQKMNHIIRYLRSNEFKLQFVNEIYRLSPDTKSRWNMSVEEMVSHTNLSSTFLKDKPGFVNELHTDYRVLVGTALIYLGKEDNTDLSTMFYTSESRDRPFRMTTNFGDGWIHSNRNETYHEGWNRTDEDRYGIILGLGVNITRVRNPT